jgi:hypothetical protein
MNESLSSQESGSITDEQAIESLRNKHTSTESKEIIDKWLDQAQKEIDTIYESEGSEAATFASINWAIRRATVYYKAGFASEAIDDLTETCDAVNSTLFDGSGLREQVVSLLESIKAGQIM